MKQTLDNLHVNLPVVNDVLIVGGHLQKKGQSPDIVLHRAIKYVKDVSCVDHLNLMSQMSQLLLWICKGQIAILWGDMGGPGGQSGGHNSLQRRLHSPLPNPAKSDKVTHHYKLLCKSPQ